MDTRIFLILAAATLCKSSINECFPLYIWGGATFLFSLPKHNDQYCTMTAITRSDAQVSVNCSSLYLPENVYLEITDGDVRWTFNQDFVVQGESLKIKLISPSKYHFENSCNLTSIVSNHSGIPVDNCRCGHNHRVSKRLLNGFERSVYQIPSAALLFNNTSNYCGATVISKRIAVTSAHCVYGRRLDGNYLLLGENDIKLFRRNEMSSLNKITEFIIHEQYDPAQVKTSLMHDIALVKTEKQILTPPACLPFATEGDSIGKNVFSVGKDTAIDMLYTAPFKICQEDKYVLADRSLMCLKPLVSDFCYMGSGGPIYYKNPHTEQHFLVGIMSRLDCSLKNNYHIRIKYFLNWISTQIRNKIDGLYVYNVEKILSNIIFFVDERFCVV